RVITYYFFFSSRIRHTRSVSAFLLNRSSDLSLNELNRGQSVRFQTALASIKLIQASAVLDLTEDDFDFLTSNKVWIATDRSRAQIGRASCSDRVLVCVLCDELCKEWVVCHDD